MFRQFVNIPGSSSFIIGSSKTIMRFKGVFYNQDFPYKLVRNTKPGIVTDILYKTIINLEL
jgi:hypothetical protein